MIIQHTHDLGADVFEVMADLVLISSAVRNATGELIDLIPEYINPAAAASSDSGPPPLTVGIPLSEQRPQYLNDVTLAAADRVLSSGTPSFIKAWPHEFTWGPGYADFAMYRCPDDRLCVIWNDVTEDTVHRIKLQEALETLEDITHDSIEAIMRIELNGTIRWANERAGELLGLPPPQFGDIIGLKAAQYIERDDWDRVHACCVTAIEQGGLHTVQFKLADRSPDIWVEATVRHARVRKDMASNLLQASMRDITKRRAITEALKREADLDGLTGLLNRKSVLRHLDMILHHPEVTTAGCIFVDLDGFKQVNDTYGHGVGDDLLIAVSRRLQSHMDDNAVGARLGGDEFLIIVRNPNDDFEQWAETIRHDLERLYRLDHAAVRVGASIGTAVSGGFIQSGDRLLRSADSAMYADKRLRRRQFPVFA